MRTARLLPPFLLAGALLGPLAGVAAAAPAVDGEFALGAQPRHLALGPDGNMWVALDGVADDVAKVAPDGSVTKYTAAAITNPVGIAAGPDGNLWVTQNGAVVRFSPADPTTARAFPVPQIVDPRAIVSGPDGNLWTASADRAIQVTTAGVARDFTVPGMGARGIARGGDGDLYIADFGGQRVVGLTTAGVPTFYRTGGGPQEVAAGPDGRIAYTNPTNVPQQVGRFVRGGSVATTDVPGTDPFGITLGDDGAWWTADFARSTISRLTTDGAVTPLAGLSAGSGPRFVATGAGGTLWVALETSQRVARVTGVTAPPPPPPPAPPAPPAPPRPVDPRPADRLAPRIALTLPRRIVAGRALTARIALSEPSALTIRFQRVLPGRRAGRACVRPTPRLRRARRCTRAVTVAKATRRAGGLRVRVVIAGRRVRAGPSRLVVTATDANGNRTTHVVRLTVR
ncbi:Vgb family protein [Conexibacter woesei]|uniref:NHL repeat containing protein n=1 Tax=Conexibacter woesei (strain DSM 14684 / CCUG 47730 / CIP 108061 / JCM 11494 / NBRC 100937 / ID131577) TaxID=469383 RepID=D3FD54_CONWI|nr:NHL repeat containing protein [Conexibacter woesei]ADB53446.1 NHL repeat containing protein [Conexibacter woesei DSM 14684]